MSELKQVSPVQQDQFMHGLTTLKRRRRNLQSMMMLGVCLSLVSLILLYFNQPLVYAYYEISPTVQHLHIPYSATQLQQDLGYHPDYFSQFFNWVLWFGLKLTSAFMGAILLIYFIKKISFIQRKLKGFLKTIGAWLLSFAVIWAAMTWFQQDIQPDDRQNERYSELVSYSDQIQRSEIYQYLDKSPINTPVDAYLLTQTALLHRPIDRDIALAYNAKLIDAEQRQPNFIEYGIQPQQLWAIQQQLYGKAVTPMAQKVQIQMDHANQIADRMHSIVLVLSIIFIVMTTLLMLLSLRFQQRLRRIDQKLLDEST